MVIEAKQRARFVLAICTTAGMLTLWAFIFKIPLSTDDWHWGNVLKQGIPLPLIDPYFFRLPVCKAIFNLTFPILLHFPFWGKLLVWGLGIFGIYLPLSWFFRKYHYYLSLLPLTALLIFFAPNQYELNYNLSSLPFCFGFLFVGLGFHLFRKGLTFPGVFLYLLSFLTLESFIVLIILLEFSAYLPDLTHRKSWMAIGRNLLSIFIPYAVVRLVLYFIHPYGYNVAQSIKLTQVRGLVIHSFLISFFKLNSILSFLQLLLFGFLAIKIIKSLHPNKRRDWLLSIIILAILFFAASSYYFILGYPAGRALAGQVAFCWGSYLLLVICYINKRRVSLPAGIILLIIFISVQIASQTLIYRTKDNNYRQISHEIASIRNELDMKTGSVDIDATKVRSHFKRDWIFGSNEDVEMMFRYFLTPFEFSRLHVRK
jgi:hypothetical protein